MATEFIVDKLEPADYPELYKQYMAEAFNKPTLEWKAYYHDWNNDKIKAFNIFDHGSFLADCKKNARKNAKDKHLFCERLKSDLMYYFWSKCEWEIVLTPWVSRSKKCEVKIDVYDQVMLNWEQFCDYVWLHGAELRRREKKKDGG